MTCKMLNLGLLHLNKMLQPLLMKKQTIGDRISFVPVCFLELIDIVCCTCINFLGSSRFFGGWQFVISLFSLLSAPRTMPLEAGLPVAASSYKAELSDSRLRELS